MADKRSQYLIDPPMPRAWNGLIFVLGLLSIVVVIVDATLDDGPVVEGLAIVDLALCSVFAFDFFWRLSRSPRKLAFVRRNWLDILGAIPLVGPLRAARLVRTVRLLRMVRVGSLVLRL